MTKGLRLIAEFAFCTALAVPLDARAEACGDVSTTGCCDGAVMKFCKADNTLSVVNCGSYGTGCNWNPGDNTYGCGDDQGIPPPAEFPKACPGAPSACVPDCTGKYCGDDGCGGTCGTCGIDQVCSATSGSCLPKDKQPCGDFPAEGCCDGVVVKVCDPQLGLMAMNCQGLHGTCAYDPNNGMPYSNFCVQTVGADQSGFKACPSAACAPVCDGKKCGDDGCGGICGTCGADQSCNAGTGQCVCKPQCDGKSCGDDGCGGVCGTCTDPKTTCGANGKCVCKPACDGRTCGDDGCGGTCGTCGTSQTCDGAKGLCVCKPDCAGKTCGDDGCGGSCGPCDPGSTCNEKSKDICGIANDLQTLTLSCPVGSVITAIKFAEYGVVSGTCPSPNVGTCNASGEIALIEQQCLNKNSCATTNWHLTLGDPCANVPKAMGVVATCSAGGGGAACTCAPNCVGKTCGDDGCGGTCGPCEGPKQCNANGQCLCVPDCTGKSCGDDGCGGTCGKCLGSSQCDANGKCVCTPDCAGKACGSDGCGGNCGPGCSNGQTCSATGQCEAPSSCSQVVPLGASIYKKKPTLPVGLQNVKQIAVLSSYGSKPTLGVALKFDGTVVAWGQHLPFIANVAALTDVTMIAAGGEHLLALKKDGTVQAVTMWTTGVHEPSDVPPGLKGVVAVAAGHNTSMALRDDGTIAVWGSQDQTTYNAIRNLHNIKGIGAAVNNLVWITSSGKVDLLSNVGELSYGVPEDLVASSVSVGGGHIVALTPDGKVVAWGENDYGETQVPADLTGVVSVAAMRRFSLALKSDGTVVGWGDPQGPVEAVKALKGVTGLGAAAADGLAYALTCAEGCGAVSPLGCCAGDTLKVCGGSGSLAQTSCAAGTCGWNSATGAFSCGTAGSLSPGNVFPKSCTTGACTPNCTGKTCGDNGCGGTCGDCASGQSCSSTGKCLCAPACAGKTCGPDGCGGTCGSCKSGEACNALGKCYVDPCGSIPQDGCCDGQTLRACSGDFNGTKSLVSTDCSAQGRVCSWFGGASSYFCTLNDLGADPSGKLPKACPGKCAPDCKDKTCGDDGCGGTCGSCKENYTCDAGTCTAVCQPDCTGQTCGPDGCGGVCGNCGIGQSCTAGQCVADPCEGVPAKGCCDGNVERICYKGKIQSTNCTPFGMRCGWGTKQNAYSCGWTDGGVDPGGTPKLCPGATCASDCVNKECGSNGCGGNCGFCPAGSPCMANGKCCKATCIGKGPGASDGCGGTCGICGPGYVWDMATGQCACVPQCTGKNCGADGCGGACGKCASNSTCDTATDQCKCVKKCDGKTCGDDGCGGLCGACAKGFGCNTAGQCENLCKPNCAGKTCGDDGCGGTCGTCSTSEFCEAKESSCRSKQCPEVPGAGCCVGDTVKTCTPDGAASTDCGKQGNVCGWDAGKKTYGCVATAKSVDPNHPRTCPGTPVCKPKCWDIPCGPDGCGGFCGTCGAGKVCNLTSRKCMVPECLTFPAVGCCEGNTWARCSSDVGKVYRTPCSAFGPGASCGWKGSEYGCGMSTASDPGGAPKACSSGVCTPDCYGKKCGDNGCGGACGEGCPDGWKCEGGTKCTPPCIPNCNYNQFGTKKQCGADGCGGVCGTCEDGGTCTEEGLCLAKDPCAGVPKIVGCCDGNTRKLCLYKKVVTETCDPGTCGWNATYGFYSCDTDGSADPSGKIPWACGGAAACKPNCVGKQCGPDGCGGWCGTCSGKGEICNLYNGKCEVTCAGIPMEGCCDGDIAQMCDNRPGESWHVSWASCADKPSCGWHAGSGTYGCNTSGGVDPKGFRLKACPKPDCTPQCDGKNCGDDGCGGACGTCAAGTTCFAETGKCVSASAAVACGEVKWEGGCDGSKALYCANGTLATQECKVGGKGECGWIPAIQAYGCGGNGGDPSGTVAKTAPGVTQACVPSCTGRQCGPDGCGGSCGGCAKGAICLGNGMCGAPGKSIAIPKGGCCLDDSTVMTPVPGLGGNADPCWSTAPDCGFDPVDKTYTCGKIGQDGFVSQDPDGIKKRACPTCPNPTGPGDGPCTFDGCGQQKGMCTAGNACNYKSGACESDNNGSCMGNSSSLDGGEYCGTALNPAWKCQCDLACVDRGDCCGDFENACGSKLVANAKCGDATCAAKAGENCRTCSGDCGSCKSLGTGFDPPWAAPFAYKVTHAGTPMVAANYVYDGLDAVFPSGSPIVTDGLLAWLPRLGARGGPPNAQVLQGVLPGKEVAGKTEYVDDAWPSILGTGFTFLKNVSGKMQPNWGTLRIRPGVALPVTPSYADKTPGGFSLAFWVRVPDKGPDVPNPLLSTRGVYGGEEVCVWSRPQDSTVTLQCPTSSGLPQQIVDVEAYYGSVANPLPAGGGCGKVAALGADHNCNYKDIQALIEKECLGKTSCHPNPWELAKDPCSPPPHVPNLSTLVLRAVCDIDKTASQTGTLVVDNAANDGRLRFEVPGLPALRGMSDLRTGKWRHVALTFHPYGNLQRSGITSLYVDGDLEGQSMDLPAPDIREFTFGAATIAGAQKAWANYTDGKLATMADFDEVFLYDRALTESQVRALGQLPAQKILHVWPAMTAGRVAQTGTWIAGGKATVAPIEVPNLLDHAATTAAGKDKLVRAPYDGLSLPQGVQFTAPVEGDVHNLSRFTFAGWVRVAKPEAGKVLLRLTQDGAPHLTVALTADCGGRGVTAWRDEKAKTPVAAECEHGVAAGEWAFVAVSQAFGNLTVYVDGYQVGSVASSSSLFDGATALTRTFRSGDGVDLLWAGLFDYIKPTQLAHWRMPGPAVWAEGGFHDVAGQSTLRDYASFHNNGATGPSDKPLVRDDLDAPAKVAPGFGPFQFGPGGGKPKSLLIPARGRLGGYNGSMARNVTFAGRVKLTGTSVEIPLIAQVLPYAGGMSTYLKSTLACERFLDGSAHKIRCHVDVVALTAFGQSKKWQSADRIAELRNNKITAKAPQAASLVVDMHVALAWDGEKPRAAFGTTSLWGPAGFGMPADVVEMVASSSPPTGAEKLVYGGHDIQGMHYLLRSTHASSTYEVEWHNLRLYGRAVTDVELQRLVAGSCDAVGCGDVGQTCEAGSQTVPVCAGCATGTQLEATGTVGGQCIAKLAFFQACKSDTQCATGLCANGRCADKSASTTCKAACGALGRNCLQINKALGSWSCSATCKDYYRAPAENPETDACLWAPQLEQGDPCADHSECKSGLCEVVGDLKYAASVNWTPGCQAGKCVGFTDGGKPLACGSRPNGYFQGDTCPPLAAGAAIADLKAKRCAAETVEQCQAEHRAPSVKPGASMAGTDAVSCPNCDATMYAGKPIWIKGWSVMAPEVCKKLHGNLVWRWIAWKAAWNDLDTEPTFPLFQKFYFNQDKPMTLAQVSQLEAEGVGPEVIAFMKGDDELRAQMRQKYGRFWLGDCARTEFDVGLSPGKFVEDPKTGKSEFLSEQTLTSPYFDGTANKLVCVANKFPNGSECPPPGSNATDAQADSFCTSGFCARDTHKCDDGEGRLEENEAADRADGQDGDGDSGSMDLTQQNNGVLEMRKLKTLLDAEKDTRPRKYSLGGGSTQNLGAFDTGASDFFSLNIDMTVEPDGGTGEFDSSVFLIGIKIPQGGDPVSSCGGAPSFKDGEYQEPPSGQACKAWAGPEDIVAPVPEVAICIPAPIGCDDEEELMAFDKVVGSTSKGKACWSKTTFVGPVPVTITAELVLEACFGIGAGVDDDTMAPEFQMVPSVACAMGVSGGVGFDLGLAELVAGVKAEITIVELAFPIKWGMVVDNAYEDGETSKIVQDLYTVRYYRKVDMELTVLKLSFAIFAEAALGGIFKTSWELALFEFEGFLFTWELANDTLSQTKIDFLKDFTASD
jgi:alpha-tubulin suppressor-like RCC1 family protein